MAQSLKMTGTKRKQQGSKNFQMKKQKENEDSKVEILTFDFESDSESDSESTSENCSDSNQELPPKEEISENLFKEKLPEELSNEELQHKELPKEVLQKDLPKELEPIDNKRVIWITRLKNYDKKFVEFQESWTIVLDKTPVEILKKLAGVVEEFFKFWRKYEQWAPIHIAASCGHLELCEYILEKG